MNTPPSSEHPVEPPQRAAHRAGIVPTGAYWRGWPEVRADLRSSVVLVLAFAVAGIVAGLLWWWLAPRVDFRITETGPVPIGNPSEELLVADDTVLLAVLAGIGLLGGIGAWFLRRRRGVATVLALSLGGCVAGLVAWQVGELLGAGPSREQVNTVGAVVTSSLTLGSLAALAVTPFAALLAYLVGVLYTPGDDLGRTGAAEDAEPPPVDERPLVDVRPA